MVNMMSMIMCGWQGQPLIPKRCGAIWERRRVGCRSDSVLFERQLSSKYVIGVASGTTFEGT